MRESKTNTSHHSPLQRARSLVVKVGTTTLTNDAGELDSEYLSDLASQICRLREKGRRVVLVSSGAVRVGLTLLGQREARTLPEKQAAAAVGQGVLMHTYHEIFGRHGLMTAQILLTRSDIENRRRFLNARNTFRRLFQVGAVPIVNENDTVSVEEIEFGDNDTLASMVAIVAECEAVVLLSDVPGFSLDQSRSQLHVLKRVDAITDEMLSAAGHAAPGGGTGGMITKLESAKVAMRSGIPLMIAGGREADVLVRITNGEEIGTLFVPLEKLSGRKRWIAFAGKSRGTLVVNEGAMHSVLTRGKSLLPVGVVSVHGQFDRGDLVSLQGPQGNVFAHGLINYSAEDSVRIAGLPSSRIAAALERDTDFDELIHRDNLVIT